MRSSSAFPQKMYEPDNSVRGCSGLSYTTCMPPQPLDIFRVRLIRNNCSWAPPTAATLLWDPSSPAPSHTLKWRKETHCRTDWRAANRLQTSDTRSRVELSYPGLIPVDPDGTCFPAPGGWSKNPNRLAPPWSCPLRVCWRRTLLFCALAHHDSTSGYRVLPSVALT